MDIYNHQSARQLGSLVKGGIERRAKTPQVPTTTGKESTDKDQGLGSMLWSGLMGGQTAHPAMRTQPARAYPHGPYRQQGGPVRRPPSYQHTTGAGDYDPLVPIKKAMKHVTPENMQKAMQWHGIMKTFLSKD